MLILLAGIVSQSERKGALRSMSESIHSLLYFILHTTTTLYFNNINYFLYLFPLFYLLAGTHDLQLMHQTLESLRVMNIYSGGSNKSPGVRESVLVPQYDKTLRAGRGDRSDRAKWINVEG